LFISIFFLAVCSNFFRFFSHALEGDYEFLMFLGRLIITLQTERKQNQPKNEKKSEEIKINQKKTKPNRKKTKPTEKIGRNRRN
jgi:hypothetical protein